MTTETVMIRTRVDRQRRDSAKIPDQMDFRLEHLDYPGGDTSQKPTLRIQIISVGPEPIEVTADEAQTLKGLSRRVEIVKERVAAPVITTAIGTVLPDVVEPREFNLARATKPALVAELERLQLAYDPKMTNAAMRGIIENNSEYEDDDDFEDEDE